MFVVYIWYYKLVIFCKGLLFSSQKVTLCINIDLYTICQVLFAYSTLQSIRTNGSTHYSNLRIKVNVLQLNFRLFT